MVLIRKIGGSYKTNAWFYINAVLIVRLSNIDLSCVDVYIFYLEPVIGSVILNMCYTKKHLGQIG